MASYSWTGNNAFNGGGSGGGGGGGSDYWADAAATFGALPAGTVVGEIRQALDTQILYRWDGGTWQVYYTPGGGASGRDLTAQWLTADGTTKTITHNWGTRNVHVEVLDNNSSYITVFPDVTRPTANSVVLTSTEAPATAWTVLLSEVLN